MLHGVFVSRDEIIRAAHYFLVLRDEMLVSRDEREGGNLHLTGVVYMYVCTYIRMCVCVRIPVCACVYVCVYISLHTRFARNSSDNAKVP